MKNLLISLPFVFLYLTHLISLAIISIVSLSRILSNFIITCLTTAFLDLGFTEILYLWVNHFHQIRETLAIISLNIFLLLPNSTHLDLYFTFPVITANGGLDYHPSAISTEFMDLLQSIDGDYRKKGSSGHCVHPDKRIILC